MRSFFAAACLLAVASAQVLDLTGAGEPAGKLLIDTKVTVSGKEVPVKLYAGESIAEVAKTFAIANKLDKEGMQSVYYFLNRKAVAGGHYKTPLGTYSGLKYGGKVLCPPSPPPLCLAPPCSYACLTPPPPTAVANVLLLLMLMLIVTRAQTQTMDLTVFEDTNAKGLAEFVAIKLEMNADAMAALTTDLAKWVIERVTLRMPVDLAAQQLGTQYLVVKKGETASTAIARFNDRLKLDFGFNLTAKGLEVSRPPARPEQSALFVFSLFVPSQEIKAGVAQALMNN